jgi:thymidylate synthase (methanogen type)
MEIYTNTLSEAHEATIDAILSRHKEIDIQTHIDKKEFTLEFEDEFGNPDEIKLKIKHPLQEPQISAGSSFGPEFTKAYKKQFLTISPIRADGNHATYTYWNRMEDFPFPSNKESFMKCILRIIKNNILNINLQYSLICGDGRGDGFKQVTELVKKLVLDPNSRRGIMITWNPLLDSASREPPCMNWLQVVIRNGIVYLRVVYRSQDALLGLPENLVGCAAFLEYITNEIVKKGLCVVPGTLTLISTIPHIYKKRDSNDLDKMIAHIQSQKKNGLWKPRIVS